MKQQTSTDNSLANLRPRWLPGQSGNPKGRTPDSVTTLLKEKDKQAVADKLYQLALDGDMKAIDVFLDRTEGKVTDKHLNLTLTATLNPEILEEAKQRLMLSKDETKALLDEFSETSVT